ncbi:MAG: DUF3857 domain-containing protein [Winogradskyella sp.]|uniref:DUF3857 domain-containing protein n=1 Tax=Winogradskyella sp. TaxID=1883156 RepID=UPI001838CC4E|nr:DUF3857 domain-containing protein [Winogradskyella sp.]
MPRLKLAISFVLVCVSLLSFSQTDSQYISLLIPDELKSKANAVVRYESQIVEILDYNEINIKTRRIVTVFNKYGENRVNAIERYDGNKKIIAINARVFNEFGKEIRKFKERDFVDVSAVSDFSIYEDDRIKYMDYTPLKYPYTVEYTSEVTTSTTAFFPDWTPIDSYFVGIEHSEYQIINTLGVELKTKKKNFQDFNIEEVSTNHFIAKNIEGLKYEVYTPDLFEIVPRFKVALKRFNMMGVDGYNDDWKTFGKWMYDKLLINTDIIPQSTIDKVKDLTVGVDDKVERAKIVYNFMQERTRYISIQVGIGGWKPMLANDVDRLGYGDCKGLTNYTKALLEAVDVPSYYTVVYGGSGIRSLDADFSSIQGNHVILCVPNEEERIFLECTSQTNPFGFTAGFTDDRDVLLVKPEGGEIVHTKIYEADDSVQNTIAKVVLDDNGGIDAEVSIETTGFQYNLHKGIENKTERDQQLHYKDYWDNINNISIDAIKIENDKDRVVYKESVELSCNNYASKAGNRLILQPNLFSKVSNLPPRYPSRNLDFKIDRAFKDVDEFIIEYPATLKVEAMSTGEELTTKFGSYQFKIEVLGGNKIKYTRTYMLNKGHYEKSDYEAFRTFSKKIVKNDKTKIVLVKV